MNQWLRLILPAHQKQPTKQKTLKPLWMLPGLILRAGGLGLVLMAWVRLLVSAESDCSRSIQDEKPHLAIPRPLKTHFKGIQILPQCVFLPTEGRWKSYSHLQACVCHFLLLFSCESKLTSAACCNKSSLIFSFPYSFLFKVGCTLDLNTLFSFL